MPDFTQLSAEQIVGYVDHHFQLFASERDDEFPANLIGKVSGPLFSTIRHREGFAIVYRAMNPLLGSDGVNANLMFVHVLPEFEGKGIGTQITEEAKAIVPSGRPIDVTCEGETRRSFFERCGLHRRGREIKEGLNYLQWTPGTPPNDAGPSANCNG